MTYVVAQLGARMHYAVPRILQSAGLLEHFYTDICAMKGWPRLVAAVPPRMLPAGLQRLAARRFAGVPRARVTAFASFGLRFVRRTTMAASPDERTAALLWGGRTFCGLVVKRGLRDAAGIYAYNGVALEAFAAARSRGKRTVLEQTIAPRRVEETLLSDERSTFPDWEVAGGLEPHAAAFVEREESEWQLADVIICGSPFVREGIAACGGPVERCVVVPYGVDAKPIQVAPRHPRTGRLRVLVAGAVGLRKGAPYVLAAARHLERQATIRMVGRLEVTGSARARLAERVELVGSVPRTRMAHHFAWADVLLLPSLCEGSATVVYEALAAGLPVVCTPNTGSIVRDGREGFIVPARDGDAVAIALERLARDPELRASMGRNALARARAFRVDDYGRRLVATLTRGSADEGVGA